MYIHVHGIYAHTTTYVVCAIPRLFEVLNHKSGFFDCELEQYSFFSASEMQDQAVGFIR